MGTCGYVAPEILKSYNEQKQFNYTKKCDIFSLGISFY